MDEEDKKQKVCCTMAELVSGIFAGWELQFNAPGYGTTRPGLEQGLFSIQVYRKLDKYKKLVVFRLISPDAPPEKVMAEIADAFLFAVQKLKEVERKSSPSGKMAESRRTWTAGTKTLTHKKYTVQ